ncbi:YajG family lipoprotein [Thalassomonas actiniarum]|uniref:Lipoprotein n=1 Tax=Thalassomonas actiniarum TaxID=485447 RepID=A0AAE9YW22_9GAMM|nr:YajG family lipoprotein [Thalassomonas actiniarum]WDE02241.1 hypothetical protein SG35_031285 [Thalassomonas actiniarum]
MMKKISLVSVILLLPLINGCAQSVQSLPILATLNPVTASALVRGEIQLEVKDGRPASPVSDDPLAIESIETNDLQDKLKLMLESQLSHRGIRVANGDDDSVLVVTVESIAHRSSDDLWQGYTYTQVKLSAVATTAEGRYQNNYQVNYSQPFHALSDNDDKKYLVSTAIFQASQKVLQDTKLLRFLMK